MARMGEPLHPEFIAEARDQLDQAETLLLSLDRSLDPAGVLHAAYRAVHAVSGLAGFLALADIQLLASTSERMLEELRLCRLPCSAARIGLLLRVVRRLREMFLGVVADSQQIAGSRPAGDQQLLREFARLFRVRLVRPIPRSHAAIPQARRFDWHGQQISTGPPRVCLL